MMGKRIITTVLLAIAVFLFLIMLSYFRSPLESHPEEEVPGFAEVEAPLVKNSNLTLNGGEKYVYRYSSENMSDNITFMVEDEANCVHIYADEEGSVGACLDRRGNDYTDSNVSFSDPYIFMFKPWMLAVEDRWKWNVSVYAVNSEMRTYVFDITYRTIRTDIINGRETYVVEIDMGGGFTIYEWIDAEKRILVRETSIASEIELVEGLG